jgi:hypothetical protein
LLRKVVKRWQGCEGPGEARSRQSPGTGAKQPCPDDGRDGGFVVFIANYFEVKQNKPGASQVHKVKTQSNEKKFKSLKA